MADHGVVTDDPKNEWNFYHRYYPAALVFAGVFSFVSAPLYRPSILNFAIWWLLFEAAYAAAYQFVARAMRKMKMTIDRRYSIHWELYYVFRLISFGVCLFAWGISLWLVGIAPTAV